MATLKTKKKALKKAPALPLPKKPKPPKKTQADIAVEKTAAKKKAMLEAFSRLGNVWGAARAVGIGRRTHYNWLEHDEKYAEAFREADEETTERLEQEVRRRAMGYEKPVFGTLPKAAGGGTGVVGSVREFSDTLLMFLLKARRPDVYRERHEVTGKNGGPIDATVTHYLIPKNGRD